MRMSKRTSDPMQQKQQQQQKRSKKKGTHGLTQLAKRQIGRCNTSECDGRGISHFGAPLTSPYY